MWLFLIFNRLTKTIRCTSRHENALRDCRNTCSSVNETRPKRGVPYQFVCFGVCVFCCFFGSTHRSVGPEPAMFRRITARGGCDATQRVGVLKKTQTWTARPWPKLAWTRRQCILNWLRPTSAGWWWWFSKPEAGGEEAVDMFKHLAFARAQELVPALGGKWFWRGKAVRPAMRGGFCSFVGGTVGALRDKVSHTW